MRTVTESQARAVRQILVEECGMSPEDRYCSFVRTITIAEPRLACTEYRFMGALGFGGKFRNNGNRNNTPYVDCYPESETPERLRMIEAANVRLAELFGT